jgi:hypothetical protein
MQVCEDIQEFFDSWHLNDQTVGNFSKVQDVFFDNGFALFFLP